MILYGVIDEQLEEDISCQGEDKTQDRIINYFRKDDDLGAGDGVVIYCNSLFFPNKTFCYGIDHREEDGKPEQGRPCGFIDGVVSEAEGDVADKGEADEVESDAGDDSLSSEFEDEFLAQKDFNPGKHLTFVFIRVLRQHAVESVGSEDEVADND